LSCFWWPGVINIWGVLVRPFVEHSLTGNCLMFFYWLNGAVGLGEEDHRSKMPFSSHHGTRYIVWIWIWLTTVDVNFDHLAEVVAVRFPTLKLLHFPSFHAVLFGKKPLNGAHA
jgi:hypothetical protein